MEIIIDGTTVASGKGTVTYNICGVTSDTSTCLAPGTHHIVSNDAANGRQTSYDLVVNPTPRLLLGSLVVTIGAGASGGQMCTPTLISANAVNPSDSVTLDVLYPGGAILAANTVAGYATVNIPVSGGLCNNLYSSTTPYTVVAQEGSWKVQQNLYVLSTVVSGGTPGLTGAQQTLTSSMSGEALIPYTYQDTITNAYTNVYVYNDGVCTEHDPGPGCRGKCCPSYTCIGNDGGPVSTTTYYPGGDSCPVTYIGAPAFGKLTPDSSSVTNTVFNYAIINGQLDEILTATVEGGDTYLQNLVTKGLYVPNMSNFDAIITPQVLYELQNNRHFGRLYTNDTACAPGWDCSQNMQYVLNATVQEHYTDGLYAQVGSGGLYKLLGVVPFNPVKYGSDLIDSARKAVAIGAGNVITYSYLDTRLTKYVPLFDLYKEIAYASPLKMYLNTTQYVEGSQTSNVLGYHRFIIVTMDRFNNTIYTPLDVDVANPVTITFNVTQQVDTNNANQTVLFVQGRAGTYSNLDTIFTPLSANQEVYLYYNTNLDFVSFNSVTNPRDAIFCGYNLQSSNKNLDCQQSDPVYTGRQLHSDLVTYAPSFNALGSCNPPPNSLLAKTWGQCNVYGSDGMNAIPQTCGSSGTGNTMYCMPLFSNGTGTCTSQLGLFSVAKVAGDGTFNALITACGSRQDSILAKYYGWPPPEPIQVTQRALAQSADFVNSAGPAVTANQLNYYFQPTQTSVTFQIGLFELDYGSLGVLTLAVGAVAALLLMFAMKGRRKERANGKRDGSG
ncbi:Uncharacterised protein [uncultured archaeon]|nr:Uncharacterised protein [uncultured archaeon]